MPNVHAGLMHIAPEGVRERIAPILGVDLLERETKIVPVDG